MNNEISKANEKAPHLLLDKVIYISRKINSFYQLPELLDAIMQTATEILKAEAASVLLLDDQKKNLVFYSVVGERKEIIKQFIVPADKGIAGYSVLNKTPVIVNDVEKDERFYQKIDEASQFKTRNIIAFPLIVKDEVIGVLEVINALNRDGFNEDDIKVLSYISELSALAIYNRVLFDNLEQTHKLTDKRVQELNALYTLLNSFSGFADKINIRAIFKHAATIIEKTIGCKRLSLFLKTPAERHVFELVSSIGFEGSNLKEGQVVSVEESRVMKLAGEAKKPIYVLNKEKNNFSIDNLLKRYNSHSFISLPISYKEEIIGYINVTDKAEEGNIREFDDFDFSLIKSVGLTLGNIYNQYQASLASIEQQIMNRELQTAAAIQRKMLTQNFPKINEMDIYALNIPARNVSGDFYGFKQIDEQKLAVYIGDVSGKGLPAAFFMATANTSLKEKAQMSDKTSVVLSELNKTLFEEAQDGMFVTLAYFVIDSKDKQLNFSFAGHNNQFLFKKRSSTVEILKTKGKPIGIIYDTDIEEKNCFFEKGDILLLFTDGVTEALLNNREEEGEILLKEVLLSSHALPAKDLAKLIKSVFLQEGKELFDDFTLVIIKF